MIDITALKGKYANLPPKLKAGYAGVWNKSETQRFLSGDYPDKELVELEAKIKRTKDTIWTLECKQGDLWENIEQWKALEDKIQNLKNEMAKAESKRQDFLEKAILINDFLEKFNNLIEV